MMSEEQLERAETYPSNASSLTNVSSLAHVDFVEPQFRKSCREDFEDRRDRFAGETPCCPEINHGDFIFVCLEIPVDDNDQYQVGLWLEDVT